MVDFILKRVGDNSLHYNLTFMKEVHKRDGTIVKEPADTIYTISLEEAKLRIAHVETAEKLGDVSLKDYLSEFYKCYNEVCELLKKIL